MEYIYVGVVCLIVGFVVGFFVGKKNGQRVLAAAGSLKDTVGKL